MADKPDRLSFLGDYAKTVITLSSALLAVSVTFTEKLVGSSPPTYSRVALPILWVALLISIFAGLWMIAYLTSVLRIRDRIEEKEDLQKAEPNNPAPQEDLRKLASEANSAQSRLSKGTNVTYWMMGAAVAALVVLGFAPRDSTKLPDIAARAKKEAAQLLQVDVQTLSLCELCLDSSDRTYHVILKRSDQTVPIQLEIDAADGRIRQLR